MARRQYNPRLERISPSGEVLITRSHLLLLQGLLDRPEGCAESATDWIRASMPYVRRFRPYMSVWCLKKCTVRVNPLWVERRWEGTRLVCTLTERGRDIVERAVPAHIIGEGSYRGLCHLAAR